MVKDYFTNCEVISPFLDGWVYNIYPLLGCICSIASEYMVILAIQFVLWKNAGSSFLGLLPLNISVHRYFGLRLGISIKGDIPLYTPKK